MDSLIVKVIHMWYPDWLPPKDSGRDWISCVCPFHGDEQASAGVSYKYDAFRCHACPMRGTALSLIQQQEGLSYSEAKRFATQVLGGVGGSLPPITAGKPSRGVPKEQRTVPRGDREVPPGVRGRPIGRP